MEDEDDNGGDAEKEEEEDLTDIELTMSDLKRFTIFFSKEINVRQTSLYIIYVDDDDDNKI